MLEPKMRQAIESGLVAGLPKSRTTPTLEDLQEWLADGGAEATDGCWVEPDGTCPHGKPSWLIVFGMI